MLKKKIGSLKREIFLPFFLFIHVISQAQISASQLDQFLNTGLKFEKLYIAYPSELKSFYSNRQYRPAWINDRHLLQNLLLLFEESAGFGLREKDYEYDLAISVKNGGREMKKEEDSIAADLQLTDAALHFMHDLLYGKPPVIGYNGPGYAPGCFDIPGLLAEALATDRLTSLASDIELRTPEYDSLQKKIRQYNKVVADSDFQEVKITSGKVTRTNKALVTKLFQLGILDSSALHLPDKELKEKVKAAQKLFNLLADGVLRSTTLEAFNIPLADRLKELNSAFNTIRWLYCARRAGKVIVVNIPSATLLVFEDGRVILESRIIVGKRSTPTPTLCSEVTEVILYPYWMVPHSIATKELLPSIKRNTGYLDANGFQVINRQGKVIDPYKINWQVLSSSNFPYIIRQSTGCDNALGLVKLNFYNPFSVYLHDTPDKGLFTFNKRYFSHGCMRVEKATDLARLVLKNNMIAIDTLEEKGCLYNQAPVVVPADEIIPVFVLYNTAWVDSAGRGSFSEDIYRKNRFAMK